MGSRCPTRGRKTVPPPERSIRHVRRSGRSGEAGTGMELQCFLIRAVLQEALESAEDENNIAALRRILEHLDSGRFRSSRR